MKKFLLSTMVFVFLFSCQKEDSSLTSTQPAAAVVAKRICATEEVYAEQLKADPTTAQLPILLMSGCLRTEVARSADFDAFLRKPFLAENLLIEVRKLLAGIKATPINLMKV